MIGLLILLGIMLASGCGVTFGALGILAWLERRYGWPRFE
jgi:hypothetical protein